MKKVYRRSTFDRARRKKAHRRLAAILRREVERAFPTAEFPPIVASEVDGSHFLVDGHHRVAIARQRGIRELEAEVTRLRTRFPLPLTPTWAGSSTSNSSGGSSRRAGWSWPGPRPGSPCPAPTARPSSSSRSRSTATT
jgi:hypothetical protein